MSTTGLQKRSKEKRVSQLELSITTLVAIGACWLSYLALIAFTESSFLTAAYTGGKEELASKIFSGIIHIFVSIAAALYYTGDIRLKSWRRISMWILGYFLFDTARSFYQWTFSHKAIYLLFPSLIHHSIVVIMLLCYFYKYPKLVAQGLLSEFTTPILYACWIFDQVGKAAVLKAFGAFLVILGFLVLRFYNFLYINNELKKRKAPTEELAMLWMVILVNVGFFAFIMDKVVEWLW